MKRLRTLTAALLALLLVLSLSACGSEQEPAEETSEEAVETMDAQTGEAAEAAEDAGVPLSDLRDQMLADCGISDYVNVETSALTNLYGIEASQVADAAGFSASSGAAFPQEIVMVRAVDETAASAIAEKLTNRLSAIAEQAASYDPDSLALAEKCEVVADGVYVGLFFSEHYDAMASAFQGALG